MNKPFEEARILGAMDRAQEILGISGRYELTILFDWGADGDIELDSDGATRVHLTTCITTAQWEYSKAKMRWFPIQAAHVSDERLLAIAVHEFVHVLLNPLDSLVAPKSVEAQTAASKANEFTTENITRVILHAAGLSYPSPNEWLETAR